MRARSFVIVATGALMLLGGAVAVAVPLPSPDPCQALYASNTIQNLQKYDACRFDRIEKAIPGNQTVTATVTRTATATATATVTAPPVTSTVTVTPTTAPSSTSATPSTDSTPASTTTTTSAPPASFTVEAGTPAAMVFPEKPGLRTDKATLTPYAGPLTVTGDTTAANCVVTQQIRVAATGHLTLDNCWIKVNVADSGYGMIGKAGRIDITHSLIDGTGFGNYTFPLILEGGGRVAFSEFIGNTDNARLSSGTVFEWNYLHNPKRTSTEAAHSDGVEVYYGARPAGVVGPHIFVENNWISIEGASGGNSDVNVTNDFGPIDGVRVKGNTFMPGGGYSLYLRGDGYCGCGGDLKNIEVQGNRWFAGVGNNYGGYYGTRSYTPERGITDWSGNTFTRTTGESFPLTLANYQP